MPGIYGLIKKKNYSEKECNILINKMTSMLQHQQGYQIDTIISDKFAFGTIAIKNQNKIDKIVYNDKTYIIVAGLIYAKSCHPLCTKAHCVFESH